MLTTLITRSMLESLAGKTSFQRGETYFSNGYVGALRVQENKVFAKVEGSNGHYLVELSSSKNNQLIAECTCPHAHNVYFCKHAVAVGLAWINHSTKPRQNDPWKNIEDYLKTQPVESLIHLLLNAAQSNDRLFQSLHLKAEQRHGKDNTEKSLRQAIDKATQVPDFIEWDEVSSYAEEFDLIVDEMAGLLTPESASLLIDLTEYAMGEIGNIVEQFDDSDGEITSIINDLGEMHLEACILAKPDPVTLAEQLFHLETTQLSDSWRFDAETYQAPLGEKGIQRYAELAKAAWEKLPPKTDNNNYDPYRSAITQMMESLAKTSGDIDQLIAIKARNISLSYHYLSITEILTEAGRHDEALDWAERGLKAFPDNLHSDLRNFLVKAYLQRNRNEEAVQLTWVQFEERPDLDAYKKLHEVTQAIGLWPEQRQRALAWLDQSIAKQAAATSKWNPKPSAPNYGRRISIALWEEDMDTALTLSQQGTCDRSLLITLAGKLEEKRADDAIKIYRQLIPSIVTQGNNPAYAEGIRLIQRVGNLMKTPEKSREFSSYLAELRLQFKPKRNFIKLLDDLVRSSVKS